MQTKTKDKKDSNRYLVFSITKSEYGIDSVFRILKVIFMEAFYLGRTPVLSNFAICPQENFSFRRKNFSFEDYLELSKGTLRRANKIDEVVKDHQLWIKEEELDLNHYTPDKVYRTGNEVISQEMNEQYDVIIRRNPTDRYVQNFFKHQKPDLLLDFPYSEKVNYLTDIVLNFLGTSRENSIAAQHYFLNKVGTMRSCFDEATRKRGSSISLRNSYYACMHVRSPKKDNLKEQKLLQFVSEKAQIKTLLSYAISKGSRLYIMSDIQAPKFFDFLKEDYKVYRYYDFPELEQLVSSKNTIDNIMLHLVEKNIMKHATVKILSPNEGATMYHLNEVYNLSILKNPPSEKAAKTTKDSSATSG